VSTPEPNLDSRSSVKVVRNAKGEAQFEVKVYAGDTEAELETAHRIAVARYRELEREFAIGARR
jgi:hypothetical protein